jgi:mutator protein MutT
VSNTRSWRAVEEQGPILVVATAIVQGDSVLLARREEPELVGGHLKWELPGGKVEFGETPEEAIKREIHEELGISIVPQVMIPYIHTNVWEKSGERKHYAIICYQSDFAGPDDFTLSHQITSKAAWFKKNEIDYDSTLPGTREFIERLSVSPSEIQELFSCLVRMEPIQDSPSSKTVDYVEIHILPNILADMWNSLGICIIIKRKHEGKIRLPPSIQPYIYKVHEKRAGLTCKMIGKERAVDEFGKITGEFKKMGYWATKFYGSGIFLNRLEAAT